MLYVKCIYCYHKNWKEGSEAAALNEEGATVCCEDCGEEFCVEESSLTVVPDDNEEE